MTRVIHNRRTDASNHAITAKTYATEAARDADIAWTQNPVNLFKTVYITAIGAVQVMTALGVWQTLVRTAMSAAVSDDADPGQVGEIRYSTGYIHVCVATNVWKRVAIVTW